MQQPRERLLDLNSGIVAGLLAMIASSGLVSPREPTHWLALATIWALAHAALKPEVFRRRFVPDASPLALAGIRVWACLVMLWAVARSDLAATARLPREMLAVGPDHTELLFRVPGFASFLTNEAALAGFQACVAITLICGAAGLLTRLTMPLAALGLFVHVAIFTNYTYFFHQWLIGAYVLAAAALTPCGDALSVDAWLRRRRGLPPVERPAAAYAWGRYLCWTALALPYVLAGLSKLRNGGWMWWTPDNLRLKVYRDSLQKGVFEPALGLDFFGLPDWTFGAIGMGTLVIEIGFFLTLFYGPARRVLPVLIASMHLGILVLQNFVFVDALLMQAIWFDWSRLGTWVREREGALIPSPAGGSIGRTLPGRVASAAFLMSLVWLLRIEKYPLSSFEMYSGVRASGPVDYVVTRAEHETRGWIPAPYERCFPAPAFNPYVRMAGYAFADPARQEVSRRFFLACAEELNRTAAPGERIQAWRMELWSWDWQAQPQGPPYGAMLDSREVRPVSAEAPGRP